MESGEIKRYYEWSSGSRAGRVEIYLAEDDNNVWFESGRFVKKELFDSQLSQISEETYLSRESQDNRPPQPVVPQSIEEWESMLGNGSPQPTSIAPPQPVQQKEKSAVQIILEKQKKLNETCLSLNIPIKIPNDKAIEFMTVMFDEDEVIDEIANFIQNQITQEQITDIVKDAIKLKVSTYSDSKEE